MPRMQMYCVKGKIIIEIIIVLHHYVANKTKGN